MTDIADAIYTAAVDGDADRLRALAAQGADFNQLDREGDPVLESIVLELVSEKKPYRCDIVALLFELGADPNTLSDSGWVAVAPAFFQGDVDMVRTFLDAGMDPNLRVPVDLELHPDATQTLLEKMVDDYEANASLPVILRTVLKGAESELGMTAADRAGVDKKIAYFRRVARALKQPPPGALALLRARGGTITAELADPAPDHNIDREVPLGELLRTVYGASIAAGIRAVTLVGGRAEGDQLRIVVEREDASRRPVSESVTVDPALLEWPAVGEHPVIAPAHSSAVDTLRAEHGLSWFDAHLVPLLRALVWPESCHTLLPMLFVADYNPPAIELIQEDPAYLHHIGAFIDDVEAWQEAIRGETFGDAVWWTERLTHVEWEREDDL